MARDGRLRHTLLRWLGYILCGGSGLVVFSVVLTFFAMLFTGFEEMLYFVLGALVVVAVSAAAFFLGRWLIKAAGPSVGPGRAKAGPVLEIHGDVGLPKVRSTSKESGDDVAIPTSQPDELVGKVKSKTAGVAGQTAPTAPAERREEWAKLMTGQLVARYKQTHDMALRDEYVRRLQKVGLTETEAMGLFMFEVMIIKHDAIERLASDGYLTGAMFDLRHVTFPQGKDWYVDHQWFLVSEIVKIWDEAEWHYFNSRGAGAPEDVWSEIYGITRYGGGELFVEYLTMVSEKAHVPLAKVNAYGVAEQQLLFAYKWNPGKGERDPYA